MRIAPYIVALSALILVGLFALQSQGTHRIGKLFGPIMTIWFVTIGALGLAGIVSHPGVLVALDPRQNFADPFGHGLTGFLVLGAVFLCATGAEALYADMGDSGPRPIRFAWYGLVLPCLLLNYAGQTAIVVDGGAGANPFFALCPAAFQVVLVALATIATIIASQAIISGAFSMTRQAIQLGLCPRLHIVQTFAAGYGQIYIGFVNWTLVLPDARPHHRLPVVRQPRRRLRKNRRIADHAAHIGVDVFDDARNLGLEPAAQPGDRGFVRHRRSGVRQRQYDEGVRRRLVPARGRRHRVLSDDHLAARPHRFAARA